MKNNDSGADPETEAQRLEEKVEAIRDNLGGLVGELDRRRHRLTATARSALPYVAGAVAAVGLAITGALAWRRRKRPSRGGRLITALQRAAAHPDRVARNQPSVAKKIIAAGGAAAASVLVRRLAEKVAAATKRPTRAAPAPTGPTRPL